MPDHGRHTGLVEVGRHEHGGIGVGVVVPLDQLQRAALDATGGVDLLHRQLGGPLHRHADRIAQRAGQSDADGTGEKVQAENSSDAASRNARAGPALWRRCWSLQVTKRSTHFLPIWTESGPRPRISTMLDWTDRSPDATFDLHGQSVIEAVANAERFLRVQAKARPGGSRPAHHRPRTGRRWRADPHPGAQPAAAR